MSKAIPKVIKQQLWEKYFEKYEVKCPVNCGKYITPFTFEIGHLVSRCNQGTNEIDNLCPICRLCNGSMGSKNFVDYVKDNNIEVDNDILKEYIARNTNIILDSIDAIKEYNLANSTIIKCMIDGTKYEKLPYHAILEHVYEIINDGAKIIKSSTLNISTMNKNDKGFKFLEDLHISVQRVDANKCMYEIINQCNIHKIVINIKIELSDKRIIMYRNNKTIKV